MLKFDISDDDGTAIGFCPEGRSHQDGAERKPVQVQAQPFKPYPIPREDFTTHGKTYYYSAEDVKATVSPEEFLLQEGVRLNGTRFPAVWRGSTDNNCALVGEAGWYDHVAGKGGDVVSLCEMVRGLSFREALDYLGEMHNVQKRTWEPSRREGLNTGRRLPKWKQPRKPAAQAAPTAKTDKPETVREFAGQYVYSDENGCPHMCVQRFHDVDAEGNRIGKTFRQFHWDGKNWAPGAPSEVLPYNYDQIARMVQTGLLPLIICEGEKDAETLTNAAFPRLETESPTEGRTAVASTMPGGANGMRKWTPEMVRGARFVIVLADKDKPGVERAKELVERFQNAGIHCMGICVPTGKDATEYAEAVGLDAMTESLPKWFQGEGGFIPLYDAERMVKDEAEEDKPEAEKVPTLADYAMTWGEMRVKTYPPQRWLVRGIVPLATGMDGQTPRGLKGDLIAKSKVGKTWVAMRLAACVASGADFWPARRCLPEAETVGAHKVLYVNMELPENQVKERLLKVCPGLGADTEKVGENLTVLTPPPGAVNLFRDPETGHATPDFLALCKGFELVILDPLYKFILPEEDENAARDMARVAAWRDDLLASGATVLTVHHEIKGKGEGRDVTDAGAGSGVLGRDYDFRIRIRVDDDGEYRALDYSSRLSASRPTDYALFHPEDGGYIPVVNPDMFVAAARAFKDEREKKADEARKSMDRKVNAEKKAWNA